MLLPKHRGLGFIKNLYWNRKEAEIGFSLISCPSFHPHLCSVKQTASRRRSRKRGRIDLLKCHNFASVVLFLSLYHPNYAWTTLTENKKASFKNPIPLNPRIMALFTNATCKLLSRPLIVSIFNLSDDGTLRFPWQQLPAVGGSQAFSCMTIRVKHC